MNDRNTSIEKGHGMTFFSTITLLGGLGLFLYGISMMGGGLEKLAGGKTENILQKLTASTAKGALLGMIITAVIQSSSGTTVILIGLVNSGIMRFSQAVGVIMGANVGTTITGQIIRLSDISGGGFLLQLAKPSTLAPVAAIVGAILYMFFRRAEKRTVGQILLGFGILFSGMFAMEEAVLPLRSSELFLRLFTELQNPIFGVLAGMAVTAVIQSSSASVGILQALTVTGFVTWGSAIPIILGQNIGTCATAFIAAIGASRGARRVAFCHLYFNLIGSVVCLCLVYGVRSVFGAPFWNDAINMGGVANFHTAFNVVSTLFFIPFSRALVKLCEWTAPEKEEERHPELSPVILDPRLYGSPSVAIAQARAAVEQMAELARLLCRDALALLLKSDAEALRLAGQREEVIDKLDVAAANYLVNITRLEISEKESREVTSLLNFVGEFERIGDYAVNIMERAGEVFDKRILFSNSAKRELGIINSAVGEIFDLTFDAFTRADLDLAAEVEPLEETVDDVCKTLHDRHIQRLKDGDCSIEAGIVFLEALSNFERISDHCSNVAARLLSDASDKPDTHTLLRKLHEGREARYNELRAYYSQKYQVPISAQVRLQA
ncbi:MAG: Na/Pi cotransporter family protein [Clostridiales Family XIII bacterium]|jgi:phosphate:Na+ symporter|nr:Na/Pi cotransporter family protein [Clostridiales Family XIII bacterium]